MPHGAGEPQGFENTMFYQDPILAVLRQSPGGLGIKQLADAMNGSIPRRTLQRQLSKMVAQNTVLRSGKGPSTRYRAAPGSHIPLVERIRDVSRFGSMSGNPSAPELQLLLTARFSMPTPPARAGISIRSPASTSDASAAPARKPALQALTAAPFSIDC